MLFQYQGGGDHWEPVDVVPGNWRPLEAQSSSLPRRFSEVEEGRLYRSGIVWPKHVPRLQGDYGITHIISLTAGDWWGEYRHDPDISIHHFPFHDRTITADRVLEISNLIDHLLSLDPSSRLHGAVLVHCFKGATRTGMVIAGHQIKKGMHPLVAIAKGVRYGLVNRSSIREILEYKEAFRNGEGS